MIKIWTFLSTWNTSRIESESQKKSAIVINQIILFYAFQTFLLSIIFLPFIWVAVKKSHTYLFIYFIPTTTLFLLLLVGYLVANLARTRVLTYIIFLTALTYIVYMSFMAGEQLGLHLYLLALLPIPFFSLQPEQKIWIQFGTTLTITAFAGCYVVFYFFEPYYPMPKQYRLILYYLTVSSIAFSIFITSYYLWKQTYKTEKALVEHKKASELLLLNILPSKIVKELADKGSVRPEYFKSTTVLFTDFEGFTRISETMSPNDIVSELHTCFSYFDTIAKQYNLEKLKTIGDSYMAVGGIPRANKSHALDAALAALAMCEVVAQINSIKKESNQPYWQIRIGLHSGPLVAGVIGNEKFSYDVWGDTVNTASRMESTSTTGKINISKQTAALIKNYANLTSRGLQPVKNKADLEMFYLDGLKKEYQDLSKNKIIYEEIRSKIHSKIEMEGFAGDLFKAGKHFIEQELLSKIFPKNKL